MPVRQLIYLLLLTVLPGLPLMASEPYAAGVPVEPLQAVAGARVVDRNPDDGLHYRLYISEKATAKAPARLMIWMHPSGGSEDKRVLTNLCPDLIAHGWALMIFPQKQYNYWNSEELNRLQPSMNDMLKNEPALGPQRPVALTFSAGGQIAHEMWCQQPQFWSGLVYNSVYPVAIKDQAMQVNVQLSAAQIASKTPILVLIGGKDAGSRLWTQVGPVWTKVGVPVEVVKVDGRDHEFLYEGQAWAKTLKWLDALMDSQKRAAKPGINP